jgi:hypothetical protein
MKKHGLRGLLLGVSLVLLLGGGVALSASLGVDVLFAQSCEEDFDGDGIPDCEDECPEQPGPRSNGGCPEGLDSDGDGIPDREDECPEQPGPRSNDGCPLPQEPEEDFVPEPGTIMLLGSGLAGLAGYATLRLRSGQALRSRTRE